MISFITGKPGDGKTLFSVRQIVYDLIETEAFVVTNIPLNMRALREHVVEQLRKRKRETVFELDSRLKVIPDADVYEFFRHRAGDLVLDWSPDKVAGDDGTKRVDRPEFVSRMKASFAKIKDNESAKIPVHYYIDEAHNFFSSREWATNGRGTLYYASQHRHLHDNVYLITQVMENVEKQLRGLCSETHMVRNQLRRRIGPIQMRPVFRVQSFYGVPSGPIKPYSTTTFDIDLAGVAKCYNTAGALGIHTTGEKQNNKAPLPWWLLPVGGVLGVLVIGLALVSLPYLGAKVGKTAVEGTLRGVTSATPLVAAAAVPSAVTADALPVSKPPAVGQTPRSDAPKVTVTGYVAYGGRINISLSDGRTLTERSPELLRVERNGVLLRSGELLYMATPAPRAPLGAGVGSTPDRRGAPLPSQDRPTGHRSEGQGVEAVTPSHPSLLPLQSGSSPKNLKPTGGPGARTAHLDSLAWARSLRSP